MNTNRALYALVVALGLVNAVWGGAAVPGVARWNFDGAENGEMPSYVSTTNITIGPLQRGNNLGDEALLNKTSASSGYTGASGGSNACARARTGALDMGDNGSAYFEFAITPHSGFTVDLSSLSFGARSTGTGPQAFAVRANVDDYAADLASETLAADSNWKLKSVALEQVVSGGKTLILRIYGYNGISKTQPGTANWRIDDLELAFTLVDTDALAAPVAYGATCVTADSFTASWSAVDGANRYHLDLYSLTVTGEVAATTMFAESFDGFVGGTPDGGAHGTDIAGNLDDYTAVDGWSGNKVYQAGGTVKMGTTAVAGWLMTPPIDLSAHGGLYKVAFKACAWAGDATDFKLYLVNGGTTNLLDTVSNLDNTAYSFRDVVVAGSGGTANSRLLFMARQASKARFFLDGLQVTQGGNPGAVQTNFLCQAAPVAGLTTNVTSLTPGVYGYRVYASDGERVSGYSNEIMVDTRTPAAPPSIGAMAGRMGRVGEPLYQELAITPSDGDAVTATNAAAVTAVSGMWMLADGIFSFTPCLDDLGERVFAFTALDKDGWSDSVALTVTVRRACISAIAVTTPTGEYTPDFAPLGDEALEWDNHAWPLPGWSAYAGLAPVTALRGGTGTGTAGGLYAWQGAEIPSLGSLAAGKTDYIYGFSLTNATGQALTNVVVGFTAEQWRVANGVPQSLVFQYSVDDHALPLTEGVWRPLVPLMFVSPLVTNEAQKAGAVYAAQQLAMALPRPVAPGKVLRLRWVDIDDAGNDHAFGLSDVRVRWAAGAMPTAIAVGWHGAVEDFDELGGAVPNALPWMWRAGYSAVARASGAYGSAASELAHLLGKQPNFSACGSYNFGAAASHDRAVGGLPGAEARSVTIYAAFYNATPAVLRRWDVAFNLEKYRSGTAATAVQMLFATDGVNWQAVGEPYVVVGDADNNGYEPEARPGAVSMVRREISLDAPLLPQAPFYLAWQIAAADGDPESGLQALAIDDFSIRPQAPVGTVLFIE